MEKIFSKKTTTKITKSLKTTTKTEGCSMPSVDNRYFHLDVLINKINDKYKHTLNDLQTKGSLYIGKITQNKNKKEE